MPSLTIFRLSYRPGERFTRQTYRGLTRQTYGGLTRQTYGGLTRQTYGGLTRLAAPKATRGWGEGQAVRDQPGNSP